MFDYLKKEQKAKQDPFAFLISFNLYTVL